MNREPENSHLEWPDHTVYPYMPRTTLTILVCPSSGISLGLGMWRGTTTTYHRYNTDRPPLVFTSPGPLHGEGKGLALKQTFWWSSQKSAITVQVCHSMLCWVSTGVNPFTFSKQKLVPLVGLLCPEASLIHSPSRSQECSWVVSYTVMLTSEEGPSDILTYRIRRW